MAIPSRQIGWGTEENLLWQISKQLERLTGVTSKIQTGGQGGGNSITLTVNTTDGTSLNGEIEVSQVTNLLYAWGDGTSTLVENQEGFGSFSHDYPELGLEYTLVIYFTNPSAVVTVGVFGND